MFISKRSLLTLTLLTGAVAATPACSSEDKPDAKSGRFGDIAFAITVDGTELTRVDYAIRNATHNITGPIDVSQPGSEISAEVGVPAGTGYTAELTATGSGGVQCRGTSSTFDVAAGAEVAVGITMRCFRNGTPIGSVIINADAGVESCPTISGYAVSPLTVGVGGRITLTSAATGPSPTTRWSEGATTIATTPSASYTCAVAGAHTLTLTVGSTLASNCADVKTIRVTCVTVTGGTGGTGGGGGTGGDGVGGGGGAVD